MQKSGILLSCFAALVGVLVLLAAACSNGTAPAPSAQTAPAEPEYSADLEPFLVSYFATWSAGDMEGYRDHFIPEAVIYLVKNGRVVMAMPRDPFVDGQKRAREHSEDPGVEKMTSFTVDEDRQAAAVNARWKLVQGDESTVGVDRFTLIRDEQWNWKIASLVYYATDHDTGKSSKRARRAKRAKNR